MEHLVSPTDPIALSTLNPGFKSLFVAGPTTLVGPVTSPRQVTTIAATAGSQVLTVSQSGIIRVIPNTVVETLTLPGVAASAGLTFEFFWTGAADGSHSTGVQSAEGSNISGTLLSNETTFASQPITNKTTISRVSTTAATNAGDRLRMTSDGVQWYCDGLGGLAGSTAAWAFS